jgi:N6-adenosine-specific RNA methylase IME4
MTIATAEPPALPSKQATLAAAGSPVSKPPQPRDVGLAGIAALPGRMRALRQEVVDALAESMAASGLIAPIAIREAEATGHYLIAGRHRLEAARKLKWETISAIVLEGADADRARLVEIDENLVRGELSPAERAQHLAERKRLYEAQHPETRQGGAPGKAGGGKKAKSANLAGFAQDTAGKTGKSSRAVHRDVQRAEACASVINDVVGTSLDKGDELDALAELPADEQRKLTDRAKAGEKVSAKTRVKQIVRARRERGLAAKTAAAAIALGQEVPASVIVADPALRFKVRSENGQDRSAENHYPCSTVDEMIALKPLMADDAVLFLWTSSPHLDNSMAILKAWGFEYKAYSSWDKEIEGTGYWGRSILELILIGTTKGSKIPAPAPGEQFPQMFRSRRREPSRKPDEVYEAIERLYPNLIKLEMFARKPRPGWRTWGNEIGPVPADDEPGVARGAS